MSVVVAMERDPHAAVLALLPWYARAQLDADEMHEVQSHLLTCPSCQAELEAEAGLQALHNLPAGASRASDDFPRGSDVEAGLRRMRARIQSASETTPKPATAAWGPRWLAWVLGLQGGAIAVLLLLLVWPRTELPAYRTLSASAPASTARALVMFKPEASERQIREALQACGASLVGGPTESRAYMLQLPRNGQKQALQRLREQPIVTLAESLDPGAAR